jgi:flagellar motor component MotA
VSDPSATLAVSGMFKVNATLKQVDDYSRLAYSEAKAIAFVKTLTGQSLKAKHVEPKPISAIIKRLSSDTVKHFVVLSVGVLSYGTLNYVSLITNCYRSVARFYY